MGKKIDFDFQQWILNHQSEGYHISQDSDRVLRLVNDYGEATITFTEIEESTIVEFSIVSKKDGSVKFYLHFELNDENHAKQLYDEMVETLIGLKDEKTLRVLLSCSAGLTTSMFAETLNSTSEMLGLDYHFDAVSYLSIYEEVDKYDVVLIAPQIGYMLSRLQESLTDKLVLQIPTPVFASYDAMGTLKFIQDEVTHFGEKKKKAKKEGCKKCVQYDYRILSITLMINNHQTRIYYRLHDKCTVIDEGTIVKPSFDIYDLYDIIDTVLLKHSYIDVIGIAAPGIIEDDKLFKEPTHGQVIDMKEDFEKKYNIEVLLYNNANAAAVGFSLEHPEYKNVVFHSQPFGAGIGGQGVVIDGKVMNGKNGIAGEVRFFIKRMQLSDEAHRLAKSQQGVLEVVTKSLLPTLCIVGPDAVALFSPMTPDMSEVKCKLKSFIPDEFMPEFYAIKEPSTYMLVGLSELCVEYIKKNK